MDLFGTVGGTVEHRSALLASRGIASLALQYFTPGKEDGLIKDMEYFVGAVDWVHDHPRVNKQGVGVIGVSKGAELAYLLTVCSPKVIIKSFL